MTALRTMVSGQLYSDNGIRKFARLWCENLFRIPVDKFKADPTSYLLDIWMDLPWTGPDMQGVIMFIAQDEELRWKVHAFDVLYCSERIVDWDPGTEERFSYRYSLEQDILVHSIAFHYGWTDSEYSFDVREDKRYG